MESTELMWLQQTHFVHSSCSKALQLRRDASFISRKINTLFLHPQGILLYSDYQASTFDMSKLPSVKFEAMDHFAKCFLILRLEASLVEGGLHTNEGSSREWRAVRVDLVSPPIDRYAFALLGWSGSRVWAITL